MEKTDVEISIFEIKRIFGEYYLYPSEGHKEMYCGDCEDESIDRLENYKFYITKEHIVVTRHECPICNQIKEKRLGLESAIRNLSIAKEIRKSRLLRIRDKKN